MPARTIVPLFVPPTDRLGVLPCAEPGVDPDELFFNQSGARLATEAASQMCERCPVSVACRSFARERREWGYWGGEAESERGTPSRAGAGVLSRR
ncbi:WhiB family transcriptional regulator [Streptomyces erythrochromogenes]|uniref:WhiB family transcriptional regulator n=1 Tax=Streptomyces erythrochromogenes TaxID=285574 RepID=UPI00342EB59E